MRGFLSGAVLGAVVSGFGLTAASFVSGDVALQPTEPDMAAAVETPALMPEIAEASDMPPETADESDVPPEMPDASDMSPEMADASDVPPEAVDVSEGAPENPVPDTMTIAEAPPAPASAVEDGAMPETAAAPDTDTLVGGATTLTAPETEGPPDTPVREESVQDVPEIPLPPNPDPETPPDLAAETPPSADGPIVPESPAAPGTPETTAALDPPPAEQPVVEPPAVTPPASPAPDSPPEATAGTIPPEAPAPDPTDGPVMVQQEPTQGVMIDRLPRIGVAPEADSPTTSENDPPPGMSGPAISTFGTPFDLPQGTPAMAIVLLDPGPGRPDPALLADFPVPLTIGIDPQGPDAAEAMAAYRAAGHEVAVLTPLSAAASAADVEQAFQVFLSAVPEAAVVLDVPEARLQENRRRAAQVSDILNETGLGMITYERGLNSGLQVAEQAGVPAAAVFRDFDDGTRPIDAMKRLLDVGAFRASQEGSVVLIGQFRPDAVTALTEWVLSTRATTVTIAPVSALLLSLQ